MRQYEIIGLTSNGQVCFEIVGMRDAQQYRETLDRFLDQLTDKDAVVVQGMDYAWSDVAAIRRAVEALPQVSAEIEGKIP